VFQLVCELCCLWGGMAQMLVFQSSLHLGSFTLSARSGMYLPVSMCFISRKDWSLL
jgi:hypothetical protein